MRPIPIVITGTATRTDAKIAPRVKIAGNGSAGRCDHMLYSSTSIILLSKKTPGDRGISERSARRSPCRSQGNYSGAQLCDFDCCLERLGRIGLVISRQNLGVCCAAYCRRRKHDRCPLWVKSGHFALPKPCPLSARSGHQRMPDKGSIQ